MLVYVCVQPEDKQKAAQQFTKLQAAMKVLGISAEEQKALWLILGAIYHLGAAGATKGTTQPRAAMYSLLVIISAKGYGIEIIHINVYCAL